MTDPARILVIDDDESIRKVLTAALEDEGYLVDVAEDGKQAIKKSNAGFYNLALIDIRLPDMEGTKLLSEMKETNPKMVKIIVTGYPSLQNAIEAVKKGANDYVIKPFKMESVLETIKRHLKEQQEEREYSEEKVKKYIETRADELSRH
ncbi:MAG TPA: response regulator [Nitrososphaerales archaeon]|nr:response regulator [Nitrososphaerales archaeon]